MKLDPVNILFEILYSPITTKLMFALAFFYQSKIIKSQKFIRIYLDCMNYANEKSFGNGYSGYFKTKMEEKIKEENFFNLKP